MKEYKFLHNQIFSSGEYSITPIRHEDRYDIMKWRNEQIYHLRQNEPLTKEQQDWYFDNVVANLFEQDNPNQILFSYLEDDKFIGYGGLVHINWKDRNAEISFIINTELEKEFFKKHWVTYLELIEQVAFDELGLHKIYTYAFDLRPHLYEAVEAAGFEKEAVLKEHCMFEGEYKDVIIHSKIDRFLSIRRAGSEDILITYRWTNDEITRANSYSQETISLEQHRRWFLSRLESNEAYYYIIEVNKEPAAIVRFDKNIEKENFVIGVNIAPEQRGKKLSSKFLSMACDEFEEIVRTPIIAYIKTTNTPSIKAFERAGFNKNRKILIKGVESYEYIRDE